MQRGGMLPLLPQGRAGEGYMFLMKNIKIIQYDPPVAETVSNS